MCRKIKGLVNVKSLEMEGRYIVSAQLILVGKAWHSCYLKEDDESEGTAPSVLMAPWKVSPNCK